MSAYLDEIRRALIKCGDDRAQLRAALSQVENWARDNEDLSWDQLRTRLNLIADFAHQSKDIGLP